MYTKDLPAWMQRLIPQAMLLDSITELRHLRFALRMEIDAHRRGEAGLTPEQYSRAIIFLEATDYYQ